jgi:hypothetical protein
LGVGVRFIALQGSSLTGGGAAKHLELKINNDKKRKDMPGILFIKFVL